MSKIGFIGLGNMGLPMAINLKKAGFQVTGFDLREDVLKEFNAQGGHVAATLADIASDCQIIITMLQTGEQVAEVYLNSEGIVAIARPDTILIDCSTIDVMTSRKLHVEASKQDLLSLDAPVSGGVLGAASGKLTFMVGGTEKAFQMAQPIFNAMGKQVIYAGEAGSGQIAKICNNMILGISMVAISEAFTLAHHLGLSDQKLFEVVTQSSGECWAMSHYVPVPNILSDVPANKDYQPGFTAAMMLKDLCLSQDSANKAGINIPLAALATSMYEKLKRDGLGERDFSSIIKNYRKIP